MRKYNFHSPFYKETTNQLYGEYCKKIIYKISPFSEKETKNKIDLIIENIENEQFSNILIYGQIQSGKTMFFTTLIFALIDKYKNPSIVILCDNNLKLMQQTYSRIYNDIQKISSINNIAIYKFNDYKNFIWEEEACSSIPRIYFCLKQKDHLENLNRIFLNTDSKKHLVIIDDESDVASVSCENGYINKILIQIIDNALARQCIVNYFPITATPYDNCTVDFNTKLKPKKIIAIEASSTYFGLKKFHDLLNNKISGNIVNIDKNYNSSSLDQCIFDFNNNVIKKSQNGKNLTLLINNEVINYEQNKLCDDIAKKLNNNNDIIISPLNATEKSKSLEENLSIDDNKIYNSQIIVGCNKVSRGVTFKNLDYMFLDGNSKINISTLLQRARWFGYRNNLDNLKIYLPEIYQDYFIKISDLVQLQNYVIKNKITISPKTYNSIFYNFKNFGNLIYSNYKLINNNNKHKIIWYDDLWKEYGDTDFNDIISILKQYNYYVINNNLIFKFKNIDELGCNKNFIKEIINNKSSYILNNKKSLVFRFIDCNKNFEFKPNFRKILKYNNKKYISVHNYNNEYDDEYFNSIVVDFVKFGAWELKNNKKIIKSYYNYKVIVKDTSLIE